MTVFEEGDVSSSMVARHNCGRLGKRRMEVPQESGSGSGRGELGLLAECPHQTLPPETH